VITVHHPDYYQGANSPADWDNPTPVPFLSATGDYLIALAGEDGLVQKAFAILGLALREEGVGAKTSSGYGRMEVQGMQASQGDPGQQKTKTGRKPGEPYVVARKRLLHETPPPGRLRGAVTQVHTSGQHARINQARGGPQLFVHHSQLRPPATRLVEGQVVEYRLGAYKGRPQAEDVEVLLEPDR